MEPLEPGTVVSFIGEGLEIPPPGRFVPDGYQDDRAVFSRSIRGQDGVVRPIVPHSVVDLDPGTALVSTSPGGGGIGDPRLRDRAAMARDVDNQLISPERAARVYGYEGGQDG